MVKNNFEKFGQEAVNKTKKITNSNFIGSKTNKNNVS